MPVSSCNQIGGMAGFNAWNTNTGIKDIVRRQDVFHRQCPHPGQLVWCVGQGNHPVVAHRPILESGQAGFGELQSLPEMLFELLFLRRKAHSRQGLERLLPCIDAELVEMYFLKAMARSIPANGRKEIRVVRMPTFQAVPTPSRSWDPDRRPKAHG